MGIWYTLGVALFAAIGTFLFVSTYPNHHIHMMLMLIGTNRVSTRVLQPRVSPKTDPHAGQGLNEGLHQRLPTRAGLITWETLPKGSPVLYVTMPGPGNKSLSNLGLSLTGRCGLHRR